jgi:hypothetical protein
MKTFVACLLMIVAVLILVPQAQARTLGIQDASWAAGDVVTVAVVLDDAKDLLSADVTLTYDPGVLNPKEVKKATLTSNFIIAYNTGTGEISIAIATAQALQGGNGALVEVSFQIASTVPVGTVTNIQISRATLYSGAYQGMDKTLQGGKVTVGNPETVTAPATPSGPASGAIGTSYSYSTAGSTSSLGHTVEYQFDWKGDGSDLSPWGSSSQSKTWSLAGTYNVRAMARCAADTSVVSGWSGILNVTISPSPPVCSYSISPTGNTLAASAGTGSVGVTAGAGCAWTASTTPGSWNWVGISSGASGIGNGTVNYFVLANNTGSTRTGTMTIAGQTFTITQSAGCSYSISPTSNTLTGGPGTGSVGVTAGAGCAWTASATLGSWDWVGISSGASGTGNGTVNYFVLANNTGSPRTGTMIIAGQTFTITQQAGSCTYTISPPSIIFTKASGAGSVNVITSSGCPWSVSTNPGSWDWIGISSGSSGIGSGTVNYFVLANNKGSSRTGTLTIAGQTFTVTQGAL